MKKAMSIWYLGARSTIYIIVCQLLLTCILQFAAFYWTLRNTVFTEPPTLGRLLGLGYVPLICTISFFILTFLLSSIAMDRRGAKPSYTLRRLQLREETTFLLLFIYHLACFLIFWAAQIIVILLMALVYKKSYPGGEQLIFVNFYRSDFLHSLLPLENVTRWCRNFAVILALSVSAAALPYHQRHQKRAVAAPLLAATSVFFFSMPPRQNADILIMFLALCVMGFQIYRVYGGYYEED